MLQARASKLQTIFIFLFIFPTIIVYTAKILLFIQKKKENKKANSAKNNATDKMQWIIRHQNIVFAEFAK